MAKKLTPFNLPIPGWNERRMTSEDFDAICSREQIMVINKAPFKTTANGFCALTVTGETVIYISPRLKGRQRVRTQFHELGHFFLRHYKHKTATVDLRQDNADLELTPTQEWAELEADVAAMVALAPGFHLRFVIRAMMPLAGRKDWTKGGKQ